MIDRILGALTARVDRDELLDVVSAERYRQFVSEDDTPITPPGADAGSVAETVGSWASRSAVMMPFGRVLYRVARLHTGSIVEFGTGAGVSAAYLTAGLRRSGHGGRVVSVEAHVALAERAGVNLRTAGFEDCQVIVGRELEVAPRLLSGLRPGLIHVDSGHRFDDTAMLVELIAHHFDQVVVCFDDIRWSEEMSRLWTEVCDGRFGASQAIDLDLWGVALIGSSPSRRPADVVRVAAPKGMRGGTVEEVGRTPDAPLEWRQAAR